jgi:hypothetical protein
MHKLGEKEQQFVFLWYDFNMKIPDTRKTGRKIKWRWFE